MKINFERNMKFHENDLEKNGYNSRITINYIKSVIRVIQIMAKIYPEKSPDEIKQMMYKYVLNVVEKYTDNADCGEAIQALIRGEKILNNDEELKKEYNNIKNQNLKSDEIDLSPKDLEKDKKDIIAFTLAHIREMQRR